MIIDDENTRNASPTFGLRWQPLVERFILRWRLTKPRYVLGGPDVVGLQQRDERGAKAFYVYWLRQVAVAARGERLCLMLEHRMGRERYDRDACRGGVSLE